MEHLFAEAVAAFGSLDILVNNASVFAFASLEQTTDDQLHKMLHTNLWGTIVTCREALKHFGGAVAYTASKAGITEVTGVLAVELASHGIRVNQINPGAVDTEGTGQLALAWWVSEAVTTARIRRGNSPCRTVLDHFTHIR